MLPAGRGTHHNVKMWMSKARSWLLAGLVATMMVPLSAQADGTDCGAPERSGYFRRNPTSPSKGVIVFVHGLMGDAINTWRHAPPWWKFGMGQATFWPCMVTGWTQLDGAVVPGADVFLYEYDAGLSAANAGIERLADDLLLQMRNHGVLDYAHIGIVAHSLGGLVSSQLLWSLRTEPDKLSRVAMVQFYGTPAQVPDLARTASKWSGSWSRLVEQLSNEQVLSAIVQRFQQVRPKLKVFCYAEADEAVVTRDGAGALCNGNALVLTKLNHTELVKPDSPDAQPHQRLLGGFLQCMAPRMREAKLWVTPGDARAATNFLDGLRAALRQDDGQERLHAMLHVYEGMSDRYLWPPGGEASLSMDNYKYANAQSFVRDLLVQLRPRTDELLAQDAVLPLARLAEQFADRRAIDLRQSLMLSGRFADDDLVLSVPVQARDAIDRVLFVVARRPGGRLGLKAMLLVPSLGQCGG